MIEGAAQHKKGSTTIKMQVNQANRLRRGGIGDGGGGSGMTMQVSQYHRPRLVLAFLETACSSVLSELRANGCCIVASFLARWDSKGTTPWTQVYSLTARG